MEKNKPAVVSKHASNSGLSAVEAEAKFVEVRLILYPLVLKVCSSCYVERV